MSIPSLTPGSSKSQHPPRVRLFDPLDPPWFMPPPDELTLRQAYMQHVLPALIEEELKPRTIEEDRSAIKKWETRTPNPGILSPRDVLTAAGRELRKALLADPKIGSRETVRKTFRHLAKIFRRLAPERSSNPNGLGIIRHPPAFKTVKRSKGRKPGRRIIASTKLEALYLGCHKALPLRSLVKCDDVRPVDIWRAALVLDHFYGPRTRDLFGMDAHPEIGIRPSSIILTPGHPDGELPFEWPWGWLSYQSEKTGVEVTVPLAPIVRAHLLPLLGRERLFPVPKKRRFYCHWAAIKAAAGTAGHFQEVRKSTNTAWNRLWPGLGKFVLGHRPEGVNETYYSDLTRKCMDLLPQFPFPDVFNDVRPRQRSLFE